MPTIKQCVFIENFGMFQYFFEKLFSFFSAIFDISCKKKSDNPLKNGITYSTLKFPELLNKGITVMTFTDLLMWRCSIKFWGWEDKISNWRPKESPSKSQKKHFHQHKHKRTQLFLFLEVEVLLSESHSLIDPYSNFKDEHRHHSIHKTRVPSHRSQPSIHHRRRKLQYPRLSPFRYHHRCFRHRRLSLR